VIHSQKPWFDAVPWESVLTLNRALCQAQKMESLHNSKGLDRARRLWEKAGSRKMSLEQACEICHECQELAPFTFNNGNTFAAIGRTFVEDHLKWMPPVEAQIIRTTICHYIVGLIGRRELAQVLRHFESSLPPGPRAANEPVAALPAPARPQEQRAPA